MEAADHQLTKEDLTKEVLELKASLFRDIPQGHCVPVSWELFQALRKGGKETKWVVRSKSGEHAWVEIMVQDTWYIVDPTAAQFQNLAAEGWVEDGWVLIRSKAEIEQQDEVKSIYSVDVTWYYELAGDNQEQILIIEHTLKKAKIEPGQSWGFITFFDAVVTEACQTGRSKIDSLKSKISHAK